MGRFGLVVIDPVRAFTDPTGVIGRLHGVEQFEVIVDTVARLAAFAATHDGPKVWVRAAYEPGQFTGGDLTAPLAPLCADPSGSDAAWDPRLVPPADAVVITKTTMDAGSCPAFVEATEAMVGQVDALLVTGFWLTACVAATATSCAQRLGDRLPVVVPLSLTAARTGLYDPEDDHPPEVDVGRHMARLRAVGVVVGHEPDRGRPNRASMGAAEGEPMIVGLLFTALQVALIVWIVMTLNTISRNTARSRELLEEQRQQSQ